MSQTHTPKRFVGEYDGSTRKAMEAAIRLHPGIASIGSARADGRYELYATRGVMDSLMLAFWETFDHIRGWPTLELHED